MKQQEEQEEDSSEEELEEEEERQQQQFSLITLLFSACSCFDFISFIATRRCQ